MRYALITLTFALTAVAVAAQTGDDAQCAAVIRAALASTRAECSNQPDQTLCYGNFPAALAMHSDDAETGFENPGDVVLLADVNRLAQQQANIAGGAWSITRMTPRISFTDDTLLVLALGQVMLENTGDAEANVPAQRVRVTSNQGGIVRAAPNANAEQVGSIFAGANALVNGTLADGSWVRVITEDGTFGWVFAPAFTASDLAGFAAVTVDSPRYGPMQAFTLQANFAQTDPCALVPPNGLLIQSPPDAEAARLQVNERRVQISAGTTLMLSAEATNTLRADVIEGDVVVTVDDEITIEAGQRVVVDGEGTPTVSGFTYEDYNALTRLPLGTLPRSPFVPVDFSVIVEAPPEGGNALEGIALEADCTIAALGGAANLREAPSPGARVRYVMQLGEWAIPDGRAGGTDEVLWWRLAEDIWVSSNAVAAAGACGTLPIVPATP